MKLILLRGSVDGLEVAPLTGAWIETGAAAYKLALASSPPSRGRGLKH